MNDENQLPVYTIDGKKLQLRKYDTLTLEEESKLLSENGENLELKAGPEAFLETVLIPLDADDKVNFKKVSYKQLTEIIVDFTIEKNRFLASMGENLKSLLKLKRGH